MVERGISVDEQSGPGGSPWKSGVRVLYGQELISLYGQKLEVDTLVGGGTPAFILASVGTDSGEAAQCCALLLAKIGHRTQRRGVRHDPEVTRSDHGKEMMTGRLLTFPISFPPQE